MSKKMLALKIITYTLLAALSVCFLSACAKQKNTSKIPEEPMEERDVTVTLENSNTRLTDRQFVSLPSGKVKADSWLAYQLKLFADNIASDFEKLSPDCSSEGENRSGWLGGNGESWERGTYYVRGLISLAYATDSQKLKEQAQKWIDWCLESQNESGAFGPLADNPKELDYWPLMPMLIALEEYCDATGDGRVVPFLEKYFTWEAAALKKKPLSSWAEARGGDNILACMWLYRINGDESLLDLCNTLYKQTFDWASSYDRNAWSETYHIVNLHESFKLLPLMYAVTGDEKYVETYYKGIENLFMASGRADGMSNGDENNRGISAVYGTETCAVSERMLSDEVALTILHDAKIADHLEMLAYNALPQQLLPDGNGQVYFTMQNQVNADLGKHGFTSDGGDRSVYGTPGGYPCCIHNYMMSWPLFVSSMWMKTGDGGYAVGSYGPCSMTDNGITLTETTNYPFEDSITITVSAKNPSGFPIYLRVPEWCEKDDVEISVNGYAQTAEWVPGEYFTLRAEWHDGDKIKLVFNSRIRLEFNENNSVSVYKGAVLFAVTPGEKWEKLDYNPNNWNLSAGKQYTSYNIYSESDWNVCLTGLNFEDPSSCFTVSGSGMNSKTRFVYNEAPVVLTAEGKILDSWQMVKSIGVAENVPVSPLTEEKLTGRSVKVRLIPYAFTRVRITAIPWSSDDGKLPELKADTGRGTFLFTNIMAPSDIKDNLTVGRTVDQYIIKLDSELSCDTEFEVIINTKKSGTVSIGSGKQSVTFDGTGINPEYRNRIELVPVGRKLDDTESAAVSLEIIPGKTVRYELELGTVSGKCYISGNHIAGIDNKGDGVTVTVEVPEDGRYVMKIYHTAPMGNATHSVDIDGNPAGTVKYSGTSTGWGAFTDKNYGEISVFLTKGKHRVKIYRSVSDKGFAEIEALTVSME